MNHSRNGAGATGHHPVDSKAETPDQTPRRLIVHVDLDAFFAAIEELDHPEYRGHPLVVGSDPREGKGRGVVSTANYAARQFGIGSALPISTAYKRCPHAIFVRPRLKRYAEVSRQIMEVFHEFSPLVEPLSLDEAFLDCTGTEGLFGPPEILGKKIKQRIQEATGLTASVGIAGNKYTAKVASDLEKPDGLTICPPGQEAEFLKDLPVDRIWGAGKVTVKRLHQMGFSTIGQLARADPDSIGIILGKSGLKMHELARGIDDRAVIPGQRRKSISEERTFLEDVHDMEYLKVMLLRIADELSAKMRKEGFSGRTITLKIRLRGFDTYTRSKTGLPVNDTESLRCFAVEQLERFDRRGLPVRLIGIGVSNLLFQNDQQPADENETGWLFPLAEHTPAHPVKKQIDPYDDPQNRQKSDPASSSPDYVLDQLRDRFGNRVSRASLLPKATEHNR